jgi:tetratricopeptide (TPR) repeat protein
MLDVHPPLLVGLMPLCYLSLNMEFREMNEKLQPIIIVFLLISGLFYPLNAQDNLEEQEINLIEGFIADGMLEQAMQRTNVFLETYPASVNRARMTYLLGQLKFRLDDYPGAEATFREYLATYANGTDRNDVTYLLATTYQFQNNFAGAKQLLNQLIRESDLGDELLHAAFKRRASVHSMLGEQESARKDLERALDIKEDIGDRIKLAHLYYEMGELRDAERAYRDLLQRQISDSEEYQRIVSHYALIKYQQEDYREVIEFLQPKIEQFRGDEIIVGALAWSHYKLGEYGAAYQLYSSRELPRQTQFERKLQSAKQFLLINEYRAAIDALTQLESEFNEPELRQEALNALFEAQFAMNDYLNSAETLEKMAPLVSNDEEAFSLYHKLGDIYLRELGNYSKAVTAYIKALSVEEEAENADDVKAALIEAHLAQGDRIPALNRMLDFIDKHEDSPHFEAILFKAGELYEAGGEFDSALEHYRKIAQLRSKSPFREAAYRSALQLVKNLQRWQEIISIGYEFLTEFPEHADIETTLQLVAQAEFMMEDFNNGIQNLERALPLVTVEETRAAVLANLAWGHYKLGELQQSGFFYQRIFEEFPNSKHFAESLYWLGWLANVNNQRDQANQYFQQLVTSFPESRFTEVALFQLASNYQRTQQVEEAIKLYRQLLLQFPAGDYVSQARNNLVNLALQQENYQVAVEALPQFQEQDPLLFASAGNLFDHGNRLAEQGNYTKAIEVFMQVRDRFPKSDVADEVRFNLGNLYYQKSDLRRAAREFEGLINDFPQSDKVVPAKYLLGQCQMQMRRFDDAVVTFKEVLAVNSDQKAQETLNYLIATCLEQDGNFVEAANHYEQFLVNLTDPGEMLSRRLEISTFLLKQGRYEPTINELRRIITNTRDDQMEMNAQYLIGQAYEDSGELETAAAEYLKVSYAHASAPAGALMARMRAARLYERLNRNDEAIAIYQNILRNHAGSRFAEVAQLRIDSMGLASEADNPEENPQAPQ